MKMREIILVVLMATLLMATSCTVVWEHEIDKNNKIKITIPSADLATQIRKLFGETPGTRQPGFAREAGPEAAPILDINARNRKGKTVLHVAARRADDPEIVQLLIDLGADPLLEDDRGRTAVDFARKNASLRGTAVLTDLEAWN